jgi:hypothetical protein
MLNYLPLRRLQALVKVSRSISDCRRKLLREKIFYFSRAGTNTYDLLWRGRVYILTGHHLSDLFHPHCAAGCWYIAAGKEVAPNATPVLLVEFRVWHIPCIGYWASKRGCFDSIPPLSVWGCTLGNIASWVMGTGGPTKIHVMGQHWSVRLHED